MARRRIDPETGQAALDQWRRARAEQAEPALASVRTAVRYTLEELAERYPGNSVEVRVPPHGATQCLAGPRHTRGTPPNVIETDPATWLELATGDLSWDQALATHRVLASGLRADLSQTLPLDRSTL